MVAALFVSATTLATTKKLTAYRSSGVARLHRVQLCPGRYLPSLRYDSSQVAESDRAQNVQSYVLSVRSLLDNYLNCGIGSVLKHEACNIYSPEQQVSLSIRSTEFQHFYEPHHVVLTVYL